MSCVYVILCLSICGVFLIENCESKEMPVFLPALHKLQKSKLSLLEKESKKLDDYLVKLRNDVQCLEEKASRNLPKVPDIQRLRDEIFRLRIDCNCLAKEVDLHGDHIPLGVTDDDSVYESIKKNDALNINKKPTEACQATVLNFEAIPTTSQIKNESSFDAHEKLIFQPFDNFVRNGEVDGPCHSQANNNQAAKVDNESDDSGGNQWICSSCTFANHPFLNRCEVCELPRNTKAVGGNNHGESLCDSAATSPLCKHSASCQHSCYCHAHL